MKMKSSFILIIFWYAIKTSSSLNLICEFKVKGDWWIMKNVYHCNVKSNLMIKTAQETIINSTKGSHIEDHTNNDVKAFVIQNYTVNYFPARIETFFKNIEFIDIRHCNLKEVHQVHIKPFPKLRGIVLYGNDIEVLENGLFESTS